MMNKKTISIVFVVLGILLFAGGLTLILLPHSSSGILSALPFIMIGIGCGVSGQGIGELVQRRKLASSPQLAKQQETEIGDERNIAIAFQAKSKAFDLMVYLFGALLLSFALFGVSAAATLSLAVAYLAVIGCRIWFAVKLNREM